MNDLQRRTYITYSLEKNRTGRFMSVFSDLVAKSFFFSLSKVCGLATRARAENFIPIRSVCNQGIVTCIRSIILCNDLCMHYLVYTWKVRGGKRSLHFHLMGAPCSRSLLSIESLCRAMVIRGRRRSSLRREIAGFVSKLNIVITLASAFL